MPAARSKAERTAIYLIAFILVVAALRAARGIVVPFLIAGFLSILGAPLLAWLERHRVRPSIAVFLVIALMTAVLLTSGAILGASVADFTARIPFYQQRVETELGELLQNQAHRDLIDRVIASVDPGAAMMFAAGILTDLIEVLGHIVIILITAAFILLEASSFPIKAGAIFGETPETREAIAEFVGSLTRYAGLKTIICLATGISVWAWVWYLDIDFPLLWGFLAFLLNYIPNIGSYVAAVPALVLGFVQFGPRWLVVVGIGYLVINVVIANLIEPRVMGRGLGLSPLVVFCSLFFFGWVLGPVGVILAVPLVMTVRIALASREPTRPLAILLGPARAASPPAPIPAKDAGREKDA
jgi:predicted PurR-regulated permease PerM